MKKVGIFILITLGLFSCWKDEKITTDQIEKENKPSKTVIKEVNEVKPIKETVLKDNTYALVNDIYSENWKNIGEKIKALSEIYEETKDIKALNQLIYLNSFYWNYTENKKQIKQLCKEDSTQATCIKDNFEVIISRPLDEDDFLLDDLEFSFNWGEKTEQRWIMKFEGNSNTHYRFKVSKKWYTDFFSQYSSIKDEWSLPEKRNISINPKLIKAEKRKRNFVNKPLKMETSNFTYEVPGDAFTKQDWTKISWPIDLFFFNITPEEQENWSANSVLNQTVFDRNGNLVWNGMITHGMPLIKAYKWNEELKISKPIIWEWKIMVKDKALGMNLKDVPKNEWLNKEELDEYKIPPFWNLSKDWVWYESELMILNSNGDYKFKLSL